MFILIHTSTVVILLFLFPLLLPHCYNLHYNWTYNHCYCYHRHKDEPYNVRAFWIPTSCDIPVSKYQDTTDTLRNISRPCMWNTLEINYTGTPGVKFLVWYLQMDSDCFISNTFLVTIYDYIPILFYAI
jgi:hypothetical protein